MRSIRLYHVTNRQSADRIVETALGLDLADYNEIYDSVKDYLNIPDSYLISPSSLANNLSMHGMTAFYGCPLIAAENIRHAAIGGSFRSVYVELLVRRAAAFSKQPFGAFKEVVENVTGGATEPVLITADVPLDLLRFSYSEAGKTVHFSKGKVDSKYIQAIESLK
jgi:hypothetical protein